MIGWSAGFLLFLITPLALQQGRFFDELTISLLLNHSLLVLSDYLGCLSWQTWSLNLIGLTSRVVHVLIDQTGDVG